MTLEEQLPLLLKAFSVLQRQLPSKSTFIAGGQTFVIADFRRMADSSTDRAVGDVLHVLLDALEARQEQQMRDELAAQFAQLSELRASTKNARAKILKSLRCLTVRAEQGKAIEQAKTLLREVNEELKESS